MEVFPIVYSRNYYMDYSPEFYVCPRIFEDEMRKRFRGYILDAIKYPNMMGYKRRVVISENGYTTFGIACDLKEYVLSNLGENKEYMRYTEDNKGRSIISFLGIFFKSSDLPENFVITEFETVIKNIFLKFIVNEKMWFDDEKNHYISENMEVETEPYQKKFSGFEKIDYCGKQIYQCSEDIDTELFSRMMSLCGGERTAYYFCSDYYGIESVKYSVFHVLTSKYIAKIKKLSNEDFIRDEITKNNNQKKRARFNQKKPQVLIVSGIVLVIVIIIVAMIADGKKVENMSRIDMNKPGAHKLTSSVDPVLRNERAESYAQYLEACCQLIKKYKEDIEFVEKMQVNLRDEKNNFFKEELPEIKKILEKEEIPREQVFKWIEEVKQNQDKSFEASEQILKEFSLASIDEMKNKLKEILNG